MKDVLTADVKVDCSVCLKVDWKAAATDDSKAVWKVAERASNSVDWTVL